MAGRHWLAVGSVTLIHQKVNGRLWHKLLSQLRAAYDRNGSELAIVPSKSFAER